MEGDTIVGIPQGKLRGKKDKSVFGTEFYCFHRIPYAKPPVGELRFKAPQPADGWTGIRDATEEGTVCPSTDMGRINFLKESSEDSLFINIFTKQNPNETAGKKLPVMVWIHGGGFEFGSGNRNMCGPDYFMLHDVVLVTFNYRIGVLGFLSLETVECPGNYGLKDQQLALRWVKNNISHFGGNPDNITIFGISAGGASVHYQTLYLANKGLFKRAIAQSGAVLNPWAHARKPRENAFVLGKRLGCITDDDKILLNFLKKAPIEDIVMKGSGIINETEGKALGEHFLCFTFTPSIEPEHEGAFLAKHPWVLMKEGKYLDVPLITGLTAAEMILGVKGTDDYPRFTKTEEFQQLIPRDIQVLKNSDRALNIARRIKEFYFKNGIDLYNYIDVLSDNFFNYGVFQYAESRVTNQNIKSPTYLYKFTYEGDQGLVKILLNLVNIKGSCHGDDMAYLFVTDFAKLDKMRPGTRDYAVMTKFTRLWTNFATTGSPVLGEPGLTWTKTSPQELEYLDLGEKFVMKKGFFKERMEFWHEIFTSYFGQ